MSQSHVVSTQVAASVPYDNATSGYGTGDTQSAIDAIAAAIAGGISNYNIVSSTAFTTSSQTDVVITGLTVTPASGTYAVWYNAESFYTTTPKSHWWSVYKAGAQIADSLRFQDTAHSNQNMADSTMTIVQVNGSQAIDVRVRCDTSGSLTVNQRSLLFIRLGP